MPIERRGRGQALRRGLGGFALALAALPAAAAGPAQAQLTQLLRAAPAERLAALEGGRKVASFCANCHGTDSVARYAELPNLAGQNPFYLLGQLDAFQADRRGETFMQGLAKVLSAEDKARVALFYASQPVTPALATAGPRSAEGREHFARNCMRCHGADARGGENFPRLAGQQPEYLRRSLLRYLQNAPGRSYPPMTLAVTALGEPNIEAVVAYLASLK